MRIFMDDNGRECKEAETSEEYLLLEIERLKQENKELKENIEKLKEDKRFWFAMMWDEPHYAGKYILSIENKAVKMEKMEEQIK